MKKLPLKKPDKTWKELATSLLILRAVGIKTSEVETIIAEVDSGKKTEVKLLVKRDQLTYGINVGIINKPFKIVWPKHVQLAAAAMRDVLTNFSLWKTKSVALQNQESILSGLERAGFALTDSKIEL